MADQEIGVWEALAKGFEHVGQGVETVLTYNTALSLMALVFIVCFGIAAYFIYRIKKSDRESSVYKDVNARCFAMVEKALEEVKQRNEPSHLSAPSTKGRRVRKKRK